MPVNMTKLNMLAQEWDPQPFLQAVDAAGSLDPQPGGAMDMGVGMEGWANMMGAAPAAPPSTPLPPGFMQQAMGAMTPTPSRVQAPGPVMPGRPAQVPVGAFPGTPQPTQIPNLAQLLGGR